jgi:co-chaperonin GroES (HSP10)
MEVLDSRASAGHKVDPEPVEVFGTVEGFQPAWNRVLIRRQKETDQLGGGLIRAQAYTEVSARGVVIACGPSSIPLPPVGSIATFSKYAESKEFDDSGDDLYAMPYAHDVHGWHDARD